MRSNFQGSNAHQHEVVDRAIDDYFQSINDTPPFADYCEDPSYCFELLSAYLDGEVTPAERKKVQQWLDGDSRVRHLYSRLLRVHETFKHAPPPPETTPAAELSERVFAKIDGQRKGGLCCVGGAMAAACALAVLSSLILHSNSPIPKLARGLFNPAPQTSEGLMIALNRPVIDIPETVSPNANQKDNQQASN